jgi:hypothetical protein
MDMSTGQFRFGSIAFTVAALLACTQAQSETPKFTLNNPIPEERYFNTAGIAISGEVEPPIHASVKVQLYHVLDNGELLPEGGASRYLDADGRFNVTLEPRAGGWTPGTFRCVVTAGSHLLRKTVDIEMIDSGVKATPIREPKDSGVVVDFSDLGKDPPRVSAGEKFRVRGLFVYGVPSNRHQGPSVSIELLMPNPMQPRPIIAQTGRALSFPADQFTCEFESEIVAPDFPAEYGLHVAIPIHDATGQRMEKHYDTVLTIVPPKDEPKK